MDSSVVIYWLKILVLPVLGWFAKVVFDRFSQKQQLQHEYRIIVFQESIATYKEMCSKMFMVNGFSQSPDFVRKCVELHVFIAENHMFISDEIIRLNTEFGKLYDQIRGKDNNVDIDKITESNRDAIIDKVKEIRYQIERDLKTKKILSKISAFN